MNYFDRVKPTYLENWPADLCRLSIAQADVPLTLAEARDLGLSIIELGEMFVPLSEEQARQQKAAEQWSRDKMWQHKGGPDPGPRVSPPKVVWARPDISGIRGRVTEAAGKFPRGAFVRLGSRSPKDAWSWGRAEPRVVAGEGDPLRYFLDCSERTAEDLKMALENDYPPHIFVREWVEIPAWAEFRCFMKGRGLVGVSQYYYHSTFPEVAARDGSLIEWGIRTFFETRFRRASHLDDVVFDVLVKIGGTPRDRHVEVVLLEVNPFFEMTDPCLFTWKGGGDFDGSFRWRKE